jgi:hypothetical protein
MYVAFIFSTNSSVMVWNMIYDICSSIYSRCRCVVSITFCLIVVSCLRILFRYLCAFFVFCDYVRFAAVDAIAVSVSMFVYFGTKLWFWQNLLKYRLALQFNNFRLTFLYL